MFNPMKLALFALLGLSTGAMAFPDDAAAAITAAPAEQAASNDRPRDGRDRGRDWDRGGRDWDRGGRDWDRGGRDWDRGRGGRGW